MRFEIERVECKKDSRCLVDIRFWGQKHHEIVDDVEEFRKRMREQMMCDRVILTYSEVEDETVNRKSDAEKVR